MVKIKGSKSKHKQLTMKATPMCFFSIETFQSLRPFVFVLSAGLFLIQLRVLVLPFVRRLCVRFALLLAASDFGHG